MVTISGSLLLPPSFIVKHAGNGLYREKIATEILSASRFDSLTILLEGLDGSNLNFCGNFYMRTEDQPSNFGISHFQTDPAHIVVLS